MLRQTRPRGSRATYIEGGGASSSAGSWLGTGLTPLSKLATQLFLHEVGKARRGSRDISKAGEGVGGRPPAIRWVVGEQGSEDQEASPLGRF